MEIIKDAFVFPSKNIRPLGIFILLTLISSVFIVVGGFAYVIGQLGDGSFIVFGGIALIIAGLIGLITSGYQISLIKSGIDHDDEAPSFMWWDNFITGFNNLLVSIVYFIIPAFIVVVTGYLTNVVGNFFAVFGEIFAQIVNVAVIGGSVDLASTAIAQAIVNLMFSLTITITVAIIVFVIFSFIQTMAQARLANTDDLLEALNVTEAAKDIKRIGIGKTIAVILLIIIVAGIVQTILSALYSVVPFLSILSIIVTPYLLFFTQRAIGLLYSDIA